MSRKTGRPRHAAVLCDSCGAVNSMPRGDGTSVCSSCGWVQRPGDVRSNAVTRPAQNGKRLLWLLAIALAGGGLIAWYLLRSTPSPTRAVASDAAIPAAVVAPASQDGNRQVTEQQPPVRAIDEGTDWTLDELLAPELPVFDTSMLELGTFERIIDETGLPTYRAKLVNRSPDRVVINPIMDLRLFSTDGNSQVPESIGGMPPMLYPGKTAWIKIGDDEDIKRIKRMEVRWHPSRGVPLADLRREANIDVKSNAMRTCHKRIINGEGDFSFNYQCVDMVGVLRNIDTRKMQLIGVRVTYYDDSGRYVGSDATRMDASLNPGDEATFELHTKLLRNRGFKRYELQYDNR